MHVLYGIHSRKTNCLSFLLDAEKAVWSRHLPFFSSVNVCSVYPVTGQVSVSPVTHHECSLPCCMTYRLIHTSKAMRLECSRPPCLSRRCVCVSVCVCACVCVCVIWRNGCSGFRKCSSRPVPLLCLPSGPAADISQCCLDWCGAEVPQAPALSVRKHSENSVKYFHSLSACCTCLWREVLTGHRFVKFLWIGATF